MQIMHPLTLKLAEFNIHLIVKHIPGHTNVIPDHISRFQIAKQLLKHHNMNEMPTAIPVHLLPGNFNISWRMTFRTAPGSNTTKIGNHSHQSLHMNSIVHICRLILILWLCTSLICIINATLRSLPFAPNCLPSHISILWAVTATQLEVFSSNS